MSMLLCLHVLDSYAELRDGRRPVFAFFFAAWPELKAQVLISPGDFWYSCDRWVLSRVAFTVAEVLTTWEQWLHVHISIPMLAPVSSVNVNSLRHLSPH